MKFIRRIRTHFLSQTHEKSNRRKIALDGQVGQAASLAEAVRDCIYATGDGS